MNRVTKLFATASLSLSAIPASATILLQVDLSVLNEITISATGGTADLTTSGGVFTGFLLGDFFAEPAEVEIAASALSLAAASAPSLLLSNLFASPGSGNTGLNLYRFGGNTEINFIEGEQAFVGSASWALSESAYESAISDGIREGFLFFPASNPGQASFLDPIGRWQVTAVPEPAAFGLLLAVASLGLVCCRRRRRSACARDTVPDLRQ